LTLEHSNGSCLHLLLSNDPEALAQCKAACKLEDTIVLADRATICLIEPGLLNADLSSTRIYCLKADLQAQGLAEKNLVADVTIINDADLIDLLYQHQHCLSWK